MRGRRRGAPSLRSSAELKGTHPPYCRFLRSRGLGPLQAPPLLRSSPVPPPPQVPDPSPVGRCGLCPLTMAFSRFSAPAPSSSPLRPLVHPLNPPPSFSFSYPPSFLAADHHQTLSSRLGERGRSPVVRVRVTVCVLQRQTLLSAASFGSAWETFKPSESIILTASSLGRSLFLGGLTGYYRGTTTVALPRLASRRQRQFYTSRKLALLCSALLYLAPPLFHPP